MKPRVCLILVAACASAFAVAHASTPPPAPLAGSDLVFLEQDGLVAVEAEHFFKQELTAVRAWHLFTPTQRPKLAPDIDGTHIVGASGGAYIEALPDTRWTHDEKLIPGENFTNEPGKIAVLSYKVHFTTPGRYHFWARVYSTGTEDNGLHVGLNGSWPESGRRWQTTKKHGWHWDSRQRTEQVHVGVPGQLFLDVPTAGEHLVQISMREDGIEVDKWLMTTDRNYTPSDAGPTPRVKSGQLPALFSVSRDYQELPPTTPLPAKSPAPSATPKQAGTPAPAAHVVSAASLPLDGTGFYLDREKWAAINPEARKEAAVKIAVPVPAGQYRITLHVVGENDGNSTYQLTLGGRPLGLFTCPPSKEMFEEGDAFAHTWPAVDVQQGDTVEVRARVASNDGKEFSRGRWSRLAFTRVSPESAKP